MIYDTWQTPPFKVGDIIKKVYSPIKIERFFLIVDINKISVADITYQVLELGAEETTFDFTVSHKNQIPGYPVEFVA